MTDTLRQRIVTAAVLLTLLLLTLLAATPVPFAALMLTLAAAGAWEWGRMNGASAATAVRQGVAVVVLGGACALVAGLPPVLPAWLWPLAALLWTALLIWALRAGPPGWSRLPAGWRAHAGVALMALTWLAVLEAYRRGVPFLLSVCSVVWACDTGAYFTGRWLGRTKLAPAISPGKTREGLAGGVAAAMLVGLIWWQAAPAGQDNLFAVLGARWGLIGGVGVMVGTALLAVLSAMGDLFESLVKRAAGVKDSSQLLPGHGGVLDRVDALLPTLVAALALVAAGVA